MPQYTPAKLASRHCSPALRVSLALILSVCFVTLAGCGGCRNETEQTKAQQAKKKQEEAKKKKEKKKKDFELGRLAIKPSESSLTPSEKIKRHTLVKPGHWVNVTQEMRTNNFDFVGNLEIGVIDKNGSPVFLRRSPHRLVSTRTAALPKGQKKYIDTTIFIPHTTGPTHVSSSLFGRNISTRIQDASEFFTPMPPYQYFFIVMAKAPDRYGYLKVLDSVRVPWTSSQLDQGYYLHYQIIMPRMKKPYPLPAHFTALTNTAYLLWDDFDPTVLSQDQRVAIIDWLHWGGQIIISGPKSLETLKGSFLDSYLPADAGSAYELTAADLSPLAEYWSVKTNSPKAYPLETVVPWSAIELRRRAGASVIPNTAGMLIERKAGRGRLVVSAFRLDERELHKWYGFDNFFNACLLRRNERLYRQSSGTGISLGFARGFNKPTRSHETTNLRIFSRDQGRKSSSIAPVVPGLQGAFYEKENQGLSDFDYYSERAVIDADYSAGMGGWSSFGKTSEAARTTLREAAGIEVPDASFVLYTVVLYVLLIVPANWLLFHAIGRVEWAWIFAPVCAVICSFFVVYMAQLDIGFARAQTDVCVLELQGDYPRAHLTRYTALYTSLGTNYDLNFKDDAAVCQPFPAEEAYQGQSSQTLRYHIANDISLEGLSILSNTTSLIHSEHLLQLKGPIKLGKSTNGSPQIYNGSEYDLDEVVVIRKRQARNRRASLEAALLGKIPAGQSVALRFTSWNSFLAQKQRWAGTQDIVQEKKRLSLDPLVELATDPNDIGVNEVRLVARIDNYLPGLKSDPEPSQIRAANLVVAHLDYGQDTAPESDVNTRFFKITEDEDTSNLDE